MSIVHPEPQQPHIKHGRGKVVTITARFPDLQAATDWFEEARDIGAFDRRAGLAQQDALDVKGQRPSVGSLIVVDTNDRPPATVVVASEVSA